MAKNMPAESCSTRSRCSLLAYFEVSHCSPIAAVLSAVVIPTSFVGRLPAHVLQGIRSLAAVGCVRGHERVSLRLRVAQTPAAGKPGRSSCRAFGICSRVGPAILPHYAGVPEAKGAIGLGDVWRQRDAADGRTVAPCLEQLQLGGHQRRAARPPILLPAQHPGVESADLLGGEQQEQLILLSPAYQFFHRGAEREIAGVRVIRGLDQAGYVGQAHLPRSLVLIQRGYFVVARRSWDRRHPCRLPLAGRDAGGPRAARHSRSSDRALAMTAVTTRSGAMVAALPVLGHVSLRLLEWRLSPFLQPAQCHDLHVFDVGGHCRLRRLRIVPGDGGQDVVMVADGALGAGAGAQRPLAGLAQRRIDVPDDGDYQIVVRGAGDSKVKGRVFVDPRTARGHCRFLRPQGLGHHGDFRVGRALGGEVGGLRLEHVAHFEGIHDGGTAARELIGERYQQAGIDRWADNGAVALAALDQAAGLQDAERLADGGPAHAELSGEVALGRQSRARRDLPRQDVLLELEYYLLVDARLRNRLVADW